jgi:DNA mismatch repair protein MutS
LAYFNSILFPHHDVGSGLEAPPDCFPDLHLDEIVTAVTTGNGDDPPGKLFHAPLHKISDVDYRHQVFRDLERQETCEPVQRFVDKMRDTRCEVGRAAKLWHPLQRQGWLAHAIESYCRAIIQRRDDLTGLQLASRGLRSFYGYLADYADSDTFRRLTADTASLHSRCPIGRERI